MGLTLQSFDISRVTCESLEEVITKGQLDLPGPTVDQLPDLIQRGTVNFYIAKLPPPHTGPFGQISIRWDSPILPGTRRALGRYLHQEPDSILVPNVALLYVGEKYRNMRLGSKLLDIVHLEANQHNNSYTYLDVAPSNPVARNMYVRRGYVSTGYVRPIDSYIHDHDFEHRAATLGMELLVRSLRNDES